jgi:predicted RNase H-like nuclease
VKSSDGCTLVALHQPTIVPNLTSMRPVERTAAGLISWLGGGVQPSNRGKVGMFCDASPIWPFLAALGATEAPEECRAAGAGLFIVEVFPALALPSIGPAFFGRLAAPRYNPARGKTFKLDDWRRVAIAAAGSFAALGFDEASAWCAE